MNEKSLSSVEEIAQDILNKMSDGAKEKLKATPANDLIIFHFTAGMDIRNIYGLWRKDHPLTQDGRHPDDISMDVIRRVWELLQ